MWEKFKNWWRKPLSPLGNIVFLTVIWAINWRYLPPVLHLLYVAVILYQGYRICKALQTKGGADGSGE